jgi:hypothetical protein
MFRRGVVPFMAMVWSYAVLGLLLKSPHLTAEPRPASADLSDPTTLASAILERAPRFSSAAVGEGAFIPSEVLAWRVIMQSPAADATFKRVLARGSVAGRLYALTGLRLTDHASYQLAVKRMLLTGGSVRTTRGCIVSTEHVADLVREIDDGTWSRDFLMAGLVP